MRELILEAFSLLRDIEWEGDFCDQPACPWCHQMPRKSDEPDSRGYAGHSEDCNLNRVMEKMERYLVDTA